MSILAKLGATAALGFIVGRLSAAPHIRELGALLRIAHHLAGHDQLTRLPNRDLARQVFLLRELRRQHTVVVLVDLDRFKDINATHGHHVGDDLLRTVGRRLAAAANAHGGIAARLGGDEFLLLLPQPGGDHPEPVTDILRALAQPTTLVTDDGAFVIRPRASAGIAAFDGGHDTFEILLRHADIALHHAKQQRGTCRSYHPGLSMPRNAGRHGPRLRERHHGTDGQVTP